MPVDFHFLVPSSAWLFFVLPILGWLWMGGKGRKKRLLHSFLHQKSFKRVLRRPKVKQRTLQFVFFISGVVFLILALMKPVGDPRYVEVGGGRGTQTLQEWVLLIDNSTSMAVQDGGSGKSRLDLAKEVADLLVQKLPSGPVSLYSFTGGIEEWVPSTWDRLFVRMMLDSIPQQVGESGGTDYLQAFLGMIRRVSQESNELQKIVIILSDGGDTLYEVAEGEVKKERKQAILAPLIEREKWNLHFVALGIGSEEGEEVPGVIYQGKSVQSSLQTDILQPIVDQGGGKLFFLTEETPLIAARRMVKWLAKLPASRSSKGDDLRSKLIYSHYFQYPLFFALFSLALSFCLRLRMPFFVLFLFFGTLQANELDVKQANMWVELQEFDKARAIYSQLQDELDEPWQGAIIEYNLAALSLKEGRFTSAGKRLEELLIWDNLSPVLLPKIHHHFALSQLSQEKINIQQYLNATEQLNREKQAWCHLQEILGRDTECKVPLKHQMANQMVLDQKGVFRLNRKDELTHSLARQSVVKRAKSLLEQFKGRESEIFGLSEWIKEMRVEDDLEQMLPDLSLNQSLLDEVRMKLWQYEMGGELPDTLEPLLEKIAKLEELGFWKKWVAYNLGYLKSASKEQAPVYLKGIFLALQQLAVAKEGEDTSPKITLSQGVMTQNLLWELSQFSSVLGVDLPPTYLKGGEGWVLQTVIPFVQEVIELQKVRLIQNSSCDPLYWEEVLQFFEEGKIRAILAVQNFEKGEMTRGIDEQTETLFFWQKALELLEELAPMEEDAQKMQELELIQQLFELDRRDRPEQAEPSGARGESLW